MLERLIYFGADVGATTSSEVRRSRRPGDGALVLDRFRLKRGKLDAHGRHPREDPVDRPSPRHLPAWHVAPSVFVSSVWKARPQTGVNRAMSSFARPRTVGQSLKGFRLEAAEGIVRAGEVVRFHGEKIRIASEPPRSETWQKLFSVSTMVEPFRQPAPPSPEEASRYKARERRNPCSARTTPRRP